MRSAKVKAYAKVNIGLKVLQRRPDGFHELRSVFQTISLADRLTLSWTPGRQSGIELASGLAIPPADNLIVRAADQILSVSGKQGRLHCVLDKQIPLGGGLGGGSADAAAVLLALPALTGATLPMERLQEIGAALGSDIPFFLYGGTALGLGRGTELHPLPDLPAAPGLVVAPDVHVATPEAYRALQRGLTLPSEAATIGGFQAFTWRVSSGGTEEGWPRCENDFEEVVFRQHPALAAVKRQLIRRGALLASMSGSGAALFGLFRSVEAARQAGSGFRTEKVFPIQLVSRRQYRAAWLRALRSHVDGVTWPPHSRYA